MSPNRAHIFHSRQLSQSADRPDRRPQEHDDARYSRQGRMGCEHDVPGERELGLELGHNLGAGLFDPGYRVPACRG